MCNAIITTTKFLSNFYGSHGCRVYVAEPPPAMDGAGPRATTYSEERRRESPTHPTPTPSWDPQAATDHHVAADGRYRSEPGTEEVAAVAMWSLHPGRSSHLHPVQRMSHMDSLCLSPTGPEQSSPHLDLQGLHRSNIRADRQCDEDPPV